MRTHYKKLMSAAAVTNTTATSDGQDLRFCLGYSVRLVYTGSSLNGSAKIQARMSEEDSWFDLPDSGSTAVHTLSASGGNHFWHITDAYYPWVRLAVTTADANTATCTAEMTSKGS